VVKNIDPDDLTSIHQPLGELLVIVARNQIPRRMIMDNYYCYRVVLDGWPEYLARMS